MSYALFLDVETTGLSPQKHQILTLALVLYDIEKNIVVKQEELVIKPNKEFEINPIAMSINKIDINNNYEHGITYEEVVNKFLEYHEHQYDYIVGHNLAFDIRFLNEYLKNNSSTFLCERKYKHICTRKLLDKLKAGGKYRGANCKLKTACNHFNIKIKRAHNALYDTLATVELFEKIGNLRQPTAKI